MLQFALRYLKHGLSVIPLRPKGKEPLIDWKPYQLQLATETELRNWWAMWPTANIGLVTGKVSNIVVVDLDGPEGIASGLRLGLKSSVVSLTGNGKHLFFRWSEGISNSASQLAEKVDVRGEGGYIVAPASIHPNGLRYRWLRPFVKGSLEAVPAKLIVSPVVKDSVIVKSDSWISESLEGMKNGNIDDTLFTICSRLRADNWSSRDALVLLKPHAERVGATPGHLEDKIENVWSRYEPNEKRTASIPVLLQESETPSNAESLEDFLETEEKVSWIVPGLIASQSLGFVVGLPETSKTWALIDLAIEAARGGNWLGVFPVKKSKVWFIDQERFRGETKRRFKGLCIAKKLNKTSLVDLKVNSGNTSFKLDLDASYTGFRKHLEQMKPDLVIIDSMATFHTKEENNRKDIQEVLERLKILRNDFNCTFILIHHENKMSFQSKEEGREPSLAEMSGNIALPAAAETVITVRKRIDGSSLVYHTKSTMSKQHKPFEIRVIDLNGPEEIEVRGYLQ